MVQTISYQIVNNNLYVVSEHCMESLRMRIEKIQNIGNNSQQ